MNSNTHAPTTIAPAGPCRLSLGCAQASSCIFGGFCSAVPGEEGAGRIQLATRILKAGDHLFRAGETFDTVYLVRGGALKTCIVTSSGTEQVVAFHTEGDIIGLDSAARGTQLCDAVALDVTTVCAVSFGQLCQAAGGSRAVCEKLLLGISGHIERGEQRLMTLGSASAIQRMATFLLQYADRLGARGQCDDEFVLPMSRGDIGRYLGLAIETVSRTLTRLRTGGHVGVDGPLISIHDRDALEAIALGEEPRTARLERRPIR